MQSLFRHGVTGAALVATALGLGACKPAEPPVPTVAAAPAQVKDMGTVLAESQPGDWRPLDPENTLYMDLEKGRVIIDMAPAFAPNHVANIKALVREGYFDGLSIMRTQENYVVQWGDADGRRAIKAAARNLAAEFAITAPADLPFTKLDSVDGYAAEVGFSGGFPMGRDPKSGLAWLAHCYSMVGVGRDTAPDSGGGTELYAVIGHAPRQLDRNVTLFGRVVRGIEFFTTLPRGTGPLGFYEQPSERILIKSIKVAADVPEAQRVKLEVMRTDTPTFAALVDSRRHRQEEWFQYDPGHVELCNVPIPVRDVAAPAQ
ncbi:MAG: peptidylprolyl isomerase [Steroidobacteraceae bacterium]